MSNDKIFIVTNFGGGKNYTPSKFDTEEKARAWFNELVTNNICDSGIYDTELKDAFGDNLDNVPYEKIIEYANEHFENIEIYDDEAFIGDLEEGGNVIQIFEL